MPILELYPNWMQQICELQPIQRITQYGILFGR
jgi:hypothetical protein